MRGEESLLYGWVGFFHFFFSLGFQLVYVEVDDEVLNFKIIYHAFICWR